MDGNQAAVLVAPELAACQNWLLGRWAAAEQPANSSPRIGMPMQRVIVMGPPGSGKSTLARRIGARHSLPVFHLDQAYWRAGWVEAPPDEFSAEVERLAALPAWVPAWGD